MAGTPLQYPLYACTVTVTNTPQNLLALIQAIGGKYKNCPGSSASYQLQADPANSNNILVGDENVAVSPQQCAALLAPGAGDSYATRCPYIGPIGSLWVVTSAATALLNLAVFQ